MKLKDLDSAARVLSEVIASATHDTKLYTSAAGTPWYDDTRVGRMIARDQALAKVDASGSFVSDVARLIEVARVWRRFRAASIAAARLRARWSATNDDELLPKIIEYDRTIVASQLLLESLLAGED